MIYSPRLFIVNKAAESRKGTPEEEDVDKILDENGALANTGTPKDTKKKRRDEDESDEDESEAGDEDDFDAANRREQRADVHEYDEEDDSSDAGDDNGVKKDKEFGTDDEGFEDAGGVVKTETEAVEGEDENEETVVEETNMKELEQEMMELADKAIEERQAAVIDIDELIADYEFDTVHSLHCQLTLSVSCSRLRFDVWSWKINVCFCFRFL